MNAPYSFSYLNFSLACLLFACVMATTVQAAESTQYWRKLGKSAAKAAQQRFDDGHRARNVILFVGDGMGISTITAARIFSGQQAGRSGEESLLAFERFPFTALVKTYNTNQQTPDSAGTMTAIVTGVKTKAGVISVGPEGLRKNCASAKGHELATLLEQAEDKGMKTGIVSTTRITHATPAATYAHSPERNWESDSDMTPQDRAEGCRDIASQLVDFNHGDGIEVILGGGRRSFLPTTAIDPEYPDKHGVRQDGRNLINEWRQRQTHSSYVWNIADFRRLSNRTERLLGLFEPSHMQFEADRDHNAEPSLKEMTAQAIKMLKKGSQGYFLMVEGGRIDHAHHLTNAYRALTDTVAFSEAVAEAVRLSSKDTLILVTADHSHTMTMGGYSVRGNAILGKVTHVDEHGRPTGEPALDGQGKPYTTLSYANGPGWHGVSHHHTKESQPAGVKRFPHIPTHFDTNATVRPILAETDTEAGSYLQTVAVPMPQETHAGEDVAVYAQGPGAFWFHGVIEQNVIYWLMRNALQSFSQQQKQP